MSERPLCLPNTPSKYPLYSDTPQPRTVANDQEAHQRDIPKNAFSLNNDKEPRKPPGLSLSETKTAAKLSIDMNTLANPGLDTSPKRNGGARRDRTDDLLNANQALSQLSYGPSLGAKPGKNSFGKPLYPGIILDRGWWAWDDSNVRPHPYQGCALTT